MKDVNRDTEEKTLIESVEKGEWKSIDNLEEEKRRYSKIFKEYSRKSERMTRDYLIKH